MKRLIAALLSVMLCISLLPAGNTALAAEQVSVRTPLAGSSDAKISNIDIAATCINGIVVPYGAEFSFNSVVGPRTEAYGYQSAPNGRGVKVTGGGVAQAAATLYLALCQLDQEIEFTEKKSYGARFRDNYVSNPEDAILVDYSSGVDFSFINWGEDFIIEMWVMDAYLYCEIKINSEEETADEAVLEWTPVPPAGARSPIAGASIWIDGSDALRNNILLAAGSINDTVLLSGDLFSFNDCVGPRVEKYGYQSAVNGRGVNVVGGGVAQVASVIWLAVKNLDGVAIVEKSTYGSRYNQNYVSGSNDAILTDYSNGTDFSFRNTGAEAITISTYVTGDMLMCDIYRN